MSENKKAEQSAYEQQESRLSAQSAAFIKLLAQRGILGDADIDDDKIRQVQKDKKRRTYLKHMFDGSYNSAGCIFLDCRNSSDFTDENNIIYGHHMKNNSMFSSITKYKQQAYYDEHPELLLMTPEQNFKIELFSGYVANVEDEAWQLIFDSEEDRAVWIERTIEKSTFNSPVIPAATDKIITLSTCSYEFDNARYVLTGVLTPIE